MILLAVITLTLLFVLRSLEQIGDALFYANAAKTGGLDIIPKKLLLEPIISIFYWTLASFPHCDAICSAQIHNFIWATAAILAIYVTIENLADSRMTAFIAALFTLVTNGFWLWSNQADAYLPIFGCFALLAMLLIRQERIQLTWKHTLVLSAMVVTSVLYHQASVLFCLPLGIYLLSNYGRHGLRQLILVLVVSGLVTLSVYIAAYLYLHPEGTLTHFIGWTSQSANANPKWGTFDNYTIKGFRALLRSQIDNIVIIPQSLKVLGKLVRLIVAFALTLVVVWNSYKIIKKAPRHEARTFFLTWWLLYSLFSLWWLPGYRQLILPNIVPVVALGSLTFRDLTALPRIYVKRTPLMIGITFVIASIFASNLFASVLPLHSSRGEAYDEARELFALAGEECLIMSGWRNGLSLEYYFDREPLYVRQQLRKFYYGSPDEKGRFAFVSSTNLCSSGVLKYILPGHRVDRVDGYEKPKEWLAFVEWLFEVKYDPQSRLLTYSIMDIAVDDDNNAYFIIDHSSRRTVPGLEAMFEELDQAVSRKMGVLTRDFSNWFVEFASSK